MHKGRGCTRRSQECLHVSLAVSTAKRSSQSRVCSLSLGVLAPYRSCKIGSALLQVPHPTHLHPYNHNQTHLSSCSPNIVAPPHQQRRHHHHLFAVCAGHCGCRPNAWPSVFARAGDESVVSREGGLLHRFRVLNLSSMPPSLGAQVSNAEAIAFYEKFGFQITETIPGAAAARAAVTTASSHHARPSGYYKRLSPSDCHKLTRDKK